MQSNLKTRMQESEFPRLFPRTREEILSEVVSAYSFPEYAKNYILQILNGERSESTLVCCHGGCDVCNDTILHCLDEVRRREELEKKALYDPSNTQSSREKK